MKIEDNLFIVVRLVIQVFDQTKNFGTHCSFHQSKKKQLDKAGASIETLSFF